MRDAAGRILIARQILYAFVCEPIALCRTIPDTSLIYSELRANTVLSMRMRC